MPPARRTMRTSLVIVSGLSLIEVVHVLLLGRGTTHSAVVVTVIGALAAIQLSYFSRPSARLEFPTGHLALTVHALLVFLPMLLFGHTWIAATGFLAGSVLLVLPRTAGWTAFTAIVIAAGGVHISAGHDLTAASLSIVTTAMAGLVLHGLPWLAALAVKVDATRSDLADRAVAEERIRVSRDLHDLLGYGLSAIKLKSELSHRLLPDHPDQARETLGEILDITRHTLVDVRSVALGYRLLSVEETFCSAKAVLTSANITVNMELDHGEIPEPAATVLATVLRESVTNVLRHSRAEHCEISLRQKEDLIELQIMNDGADESPCDPSGSGVRNMTERVDEIGGSFTSRRESGRFHLHAQIPL